MVSRAGIYTRISVDRAKDDPELQKESPKRQAEDCRRRCEAEGFEVVGVYEDRDVSAYKPGTYRPEFERLLTDLRDRKLDAVVVWKLDRLTRGGLRAIGSFTQALEDADAFLLTVHDGIDTRNVGGELLLGVMASIAKSESENTSIRVKGANRHAATEGRPHGGGHRLYGYNRDQTVHEAERQNLRMMGDLLVKGWSLRKVAAFANNLKWKTTAGNDWTPGSISQTLRSVRLRGFREHDGEFYRGNWEPIFEEGEHLTILQSLGDPTSPARMRTDRLLTGSVVCGRCGAKLGHGKFQGKGEVFLRYACKRTPGLRGCGRLAVSMASLDALVGREIVRTMREHNLDTNETASEDREARRSALMREKEADSEAIEKLADDFYLHRRVPENTYRRIRLQLEERVASIQADLAAIDSPSKTSTKFDWNQGSDHPEQAWAMMSTLDQREVVRGLIDSITVMPAKTVGGNKFDESRVVIAWKADLVAAS